MKLVRMAIIWKEYAKTIKIMVNAGMDVVADLYTFI